MSLALLHSPADVLRWVLIALGQGTDPDAGAPWPVYATGEPPLPDNCITVYDTTPKYDGRSMIDGETWRHLGIQVRIRAQDATTGYAKAEAIRVALDEQVLDRVVALDTTHYLVYSVDSTSLIALGKEVPNSKRSLFTANAIFTLKRLN